MDSSDPTAMNAQNSARSSFDTKLRLRPETEADIPFLQAVYASTRWQELEVAPWTDAQKLEFLHSQFALQRMHYYKFYEGARFDVIELEQQRVGRVYVHRDVEIRIMEIALLPEFKYRGIGKHYFAQFFQEARATQKPITLHVEHNNPAKIWYAKLGFVELEDTGVYMKMRWQP
jgi:ribosomal protein S18 acetylase RimI-like enzyme